MGEFHVQFATTYMPMYHQKRRKTYNSTSISKILQIKGGLVIQPCILPKSYVARLDTRVRHLAYAHHRMRKSYLEITTGRLRKWTPLACYRLALGFN